MLSPLSRCVVYPFLAAVCGAVLLYLVTRLSLWPVDYPGWLQFSEPGAAPCPLLAGATVITLTLLAARSTLWLPWALALLLSGFWLLMEARPMGDSGHWLSHAPERELWLSEFLANYIYHLAYQLSIEFQYVAPAFGLLLVLAWFSLRPVLLEPGYDRVWQLILAFSLTSSVIIALYTRNFIENTLLSVPVLLLHLRYALHYAATDQCRSRWLAALLLALAILIHGQNLFMLPAFLLLMLLHLSAKTAPGQAVRITAQTGLVIALCIAAVIALFHLAGFNVVAGNVQGGGDGSRFVPLFADQASHFVRFLLFSAPHFAEISNIMLHVAPLLLAVPLALLSAGTPGLERLRADRVFVALSIYASAYLGFIFLWNFDLGYPTDLDLMVSLGVTLNLAVLRLLYLLLPNRRYWLLAVSLVLTLLNFHFIGHFVY